MCQAFAASDRDLTYSSKTNTFFTYLWCRNADFTLNYSNNFHLSDLCLSPTSSLSIFRHLWHCRHTWFCDLLPMKPAPPFTRALIPAVSRGFPGVALLCLVWHLAQVTSALQSHPILLTEACMCFRPFEGFFFFFFLYVGTSIMSKNLLIILWRLAWRDFWIFSITFPWQSN